jgi:FkbM family methyltransferase
LSNAFSLLRKDISWLSQSEGASTISAKLFLFALKLGYVSLRVILRLLFGKKRRDKIFLDRRLDFATLWNKYVRLYMKTHLRSELLRFKMPKYDFEFYCRDNSDDFKTMTYHEGDIIEDHFTPKEGDIVIDIGAHIGLYTIIASKRVGMQGKVVAIEADPKNFEVLNRNIELNNLRNVIALNYAAYSEEKKMKLYLPGQAKLSQTIYNTLMSGRAHGVEEFVEVNANMLDFLLQSTGIKHEEVNWIKIDVEGAEYEVLKGAKDTLSKSKDISLLIEVHNLSETTNLYKPISEFISLYNFKIDFEKLHSSGERHIIARKKYHP